MSEIIEPRLLPIPDSDFVQQTLLIQNQDPAPTPLPAPELPTAEYKQTEAMAQAWAGHLKKTLQSKKFYKSGRAPGCGDFDFDDYLEGLQVNGRYEECFEAASRCSTRSLDEETAWRGAQCATSLYRWNEALKFYQVSLKSKRQRHLYNPVLFSYGSFLLVSPFAQQQAVLLRQAAPQLSEADLQFFSQVIEYTVLKKSFQDQDRRILEFLNLASAQSHAPTAAFFTYVKTQALYDRYKYTEARDFFNARMKKMTEVDQLWPLAYNLLYNNKADLFKLSDLVYRVYQPYGHWRSAWPIESNVYNYTELYQTQCRDTLLQNEDYALLKRFQKEWQSTKISSEQFYLNVQQLLQKKPNAADLLSTLGGLEMLKQNTSAALQAFWKAHQACPYYNRAHWGLLSLRRAQRQASYPDYAELEAKVKSGIDGIDFGQRIERYVLNYINLNDELREKLKYGARIWGPYFDLLESEKNNVYIKFAFELLSETPQLGSLRDVRISGPGYPEDNRLWDDVRGAGGAMVIADFGELKQISQGAYNTIGHEISHQYHFYLKRRELQAAACIDRLYDLARARNIFADGYAAQNVHEYFAQAVTYDLVPEDSPKRFGINRSWNKAHDPQMFELIRSIEKNKVICPLN